MISQRRGRIRKQTSDAEKEACGESITDNVTASSDLRPVAETARAFHHGATRVDMSRAVVYYWPKSVFVCCFLLATSLVLNIPSKLDLEYDSYLGRGFPPEVLLGTKAVQLQDVKILDPCSTFLGYCHVNNVMLHRLQIYGDFATIPSSLANATQDLIAPIQFVVRNDQAQQAETILTQFLGYKSAVRRSDNEAPTCDATIDTPTFLVDVFWWYKSNYFHVHYDTLLPLYKQLLTSELLEYGSFGGGRRMIRPNVLIMPVVRDRGKYVVWNTSLFREPFLRASDFHNSGLQLLSRHSLVPLDIRNFPMNGSAGRKNICFRDLYIDLPPFHDSFPESQDPEAVSRNVNSFIDYMKYQALGEQPPPLITKPRIAFISRADQRRRRCIINEGEVVRYLNSKLKPSAEVDLVSFRGTVAQQIQSVQNYAVLVGMNGAGLMNGIYLPKGAVSVQLVPPPPPDLNWIRFGSLLAMRGPYMVWHNERPNTTYPGGDIILFPEDALRIVRDALKLVGVNARIFHNATEI